MVWMFEFVVDVDVGNGFGGRREFHCVGLVVVGLWFLWGALRWFLFVGIGLRFGEWFRDWFGLDGLRLVGMFGFLPRCRMRLHALRLGTGGLPVVETGMSRGVLHNVVDVSIGERSGVVLEGEVKGGLLVVFLFLVVRGFGFGREGGVDRGMRGLGGERIGDRSYHDRNG